MLKKVDIGTQIRNKHKYFWPIVVGILFFLFFISSSVYYFLKLRKSDDALISEHVQKLSDIFKIINQQTNIMKIEGDRATIDFLNTKSFAGSSVGPLVLQYPQKWQGPYLIDEPRIQNKLYQILKTKKGYYIVPGDGVRLQNGKVLGKDLILNINSDIESLLLDFKGLLGKNGKPLASKISITNNPFDLLVSQDPFAFSPHDD